MLNIILLDNVTKETLVFNVCKQTGMYYLCTLHKVMVFYSIPKY